jgi:hypothetical protein
MVKQSNYKPGEALIFPEGWGSRISRQLAYECGKVSPTHWPPFPHRRYYWYSLLLEADSIPRAIVRSEVLCQWKIPMTPSGIEPATVAQCLNRLRHRVPQYIIRNYRNYRFATTVQSLYLVITCGNIYVFINGVVLVESKRHRRWMVISLLALTCNDFIFARQ